MPFFTFRESTIVSLYILFKERELETRPVCVVTKETTSDLEDVSTNDANTYNMLKNHVVDCRTLGIVQWDAKSKDCGDQAIKIFESRSPISSESSPDQVNPSSDRKDRTSKKPNYVTNSDNDSLTNSSTKRRKNKRFEDQEQYICSTCKLHFDRQGDYKRHMIKHSNLRPYKCEICDKAFKRSSEVSNHTQIHRGIEYACEVCGFTTINKFSLRMHHRRVHQRDFRYRCDQCDKGFMSNYDLEDHKASHLGRKTFICEFCGNAYSQKSYLVAHKRVIHRIQKSAPKEFQCNICNKSFATEQNLRNHVGLHSQTFLCAQCGKKFATNHALKLHGRKHTGERPYECMVCSKAFARSAALRVHKLTHTGERPYVCDLCGQSFTQRSSMMVHRRKHPGSHPPPPPLLLSRLESDGHKL